MKKLVFLFLLWFSCCICYAADPCSDIQDIMKDSIYTFSVTGAGDAAYPNNVAGTGDCSSNTNQGGREKIYRFEVPATGTYQVNSVENSGSKGVGFYYKRGNACGPTGWTCLDRNTGDNRSVGSINATKGDIILLLLNAELTSTTTQTFQVVAPNAPLPLKLLSFEVVHAEGTNKLRWATISETNTNYFGVEHSTNGRTYIELTKIKASARSNETTAYEAKDQNPSSGLNYYRLRTVDQDGKFSYSNVITINLKHKIGLTTFPNPVRDELHVQVYRTLTETALLQIVDLEGRVVQQMAKQLYNGINAFDLNTSMLTKGNYILVLKGKETEQKMFTKQ